LLFHGTFLLNCDLNLIQECLHPPSKEPDYRHNRPHKDFLTNLKIGVPELKAELARAWQATSAFEADLSRQIGELVKEKYSRDDWNLKW
jgi:lipoate-protein ligase A